jgi:kynurenine formamidase
MESLPGGHRITAAELEAACVQGAISVEPGDVVLIRTGWPHSHWQDSIAFVGFMSGVPGPDEGAARWLTSKKVFLTGADTIAFEWLAPQAGHSLLPVHAILLVEEGIHILEVLNLEGLAQDGVREFLFVASPLKIVGATGSPVRPLALVQ